MIRWLVLISVMMLTACASSGSGQVSKEDKDLGEAVEEHNATAERGDRVVCSRERVSGTNIARKICRTERQIEAEREHAREAMDEIRRTVGDSSSGGIGG